MFALLFAMLAATPSALAEAKGLAIVGAKVYPAPDAQAIDDAVVLVHDGKIAAVGKRGVVVVPPGTQVVDGAGKVVTAGFWNCHVHFTEHVWNDAGQAPAARLDEHMRKMLTRWGFTTVFDIASFLKNTNALRARIEGGEVLGPRILTTGEPLYPHKGIPGYVGPEWQIPQAGSPADGQRMAQQRFADGADGIKVFSGAITRAGVVPLDPAIIRAAAEVAHAAGKPVFTHPSNRAGIDNALAGGVDVLAHAAPMAQAFTKEELVRMKKQKVALIPTLTLFPYEAEKFGGTRAEAAADLQTAVQQLQSYVQEGGTILFGTDVGYTTRYDTTSEFESMARAGMTWRDILASLTTNPSTFFKASNTGRVQVGMAADLVVLDADPARDVRNFAKVAGAIRAGKVIFSK
jgi:imidazolonepropionase-like amidohydrolase